MRSTAKPTLLCPHTDTAATGMSCDVIGRRVAWNSTILFGGIFGIAAGAANNFVTLGAMIAMIGFGVGGVSFRIFLK